MSALFTAPQTLPFGIALLIMLGIGVLEGVGMFAAASPSELIEHHLHIDHPQADGLLGWLHVGKVPLLVLLVLFLLGFSLGGYLLQIAVHAVFGTFGPALAVAVPAFFIGTANVRSLGALLARIIPRDETTAVSEETLIGRAGVVLTGVARTGMAAEVKVRDQHGNAHYLMVEPDIAGEEFAEGSEVLIVRRIGAMYRGIRNPHPALNRQ